eukprot:7379930-Prymnesium_polylepis.2
MPPRTARATCVSNSDVMVKMCGVHPRSRLQQAREPKVPPECESLRKDEVQVGSKLLSEPKAHFAAGEQQIDRAVVLRCFALRSGAVKVETLAKLAREIPCGDPGFLAGHVRWDRARSRRSEVSRAGCHPTEVCGPRKAVTSHPPSSWCQRAAWLNSGRSGRSQCRPARLPHPAYAAALRAVSPRWRRPDPTAAAGARRSHHPGQSGTSPSRPPASVPWWRKPRSQMRRGQSSGRRRHSSSGPARQSPSRGLRRANARARGRRSLRAKHKCGQRSVRGSRRMPCVTRHRGERASERSMGGLPQLLTLRTLQQGERRLEQVLIEEGTDRLDHGAAESIRTRTGGKPDGEWCVVAAKQLHHATFHGLGQRLDDRGL